MINKAFANLLASEFFGNANLPGQLRTFCELSANFLLDRHGQP